MKGFLQRLSASVMNRRAEVQPLAGSVFSKHLAPEISTIYAAETAPREVNARLNTSVSESDPSPQPALRREAPVEAGDRPYVRSSAQPSLVPPFQALVPPSPTESVLPAREPDVVAEIPSAESSGARLERRIYISEPPQTEVIDRLVPVVPEIARDPRAIIAPPRADRRAIAIPQSVAAAPAQEPDIEIHIGRIEVLAVPQSARPTPPPPRKAFDLGAYLKRSDARVR
jgi:hypothetical protein